MKFIIDLLAKMFFKNYIDYSIKKSSLNKCSTILYLYFLFKGYLQK